MAQIKTTDLDRRFLQLAVEVSAATDDPKAVEDHQAAVGAVIVKDQRVISASANRLPPSLRGKIEGLRVTSNARYFLIEHAERCAIFDAAIAGEDIAGSTMFCTRFPCIDCARTIAYFRVARLVLGSGFRHERRWINSQREAHRLLRASNIKIRFMRI
jgi:dCMP deaminase